jgi:hypothetical protein
MKQFLEPRLFKGFLILFVMLPLLFFSAVTVFVYDLVKSIWS